jgi:hypothetical protein
VPYQPGENLAWRDVRRETVCFAWPNRVIEDGGRGLLLARCPGAVGKVVRGYPEDPAQMRHELGRATPSLVDLRWSGTITLGVHVDHAYWSTRLMWRADTGTFLCYYIDFCRPLIRAPGRIDSLDLALDMVVDPDGAWRWKDIAEYEELCVAGVIDREDRAAVAAATPVVIRAIESGAFPFDGSLVSWKWPPDLALPELPPQWAERPAPG